ncbi:bifunctional sterol desaturase/short chain dehydrogenase [Candidatus Cyanaurora vandensis]|uniref:bifunctional sterol desaturase/short chain dehydrogenase n=1 Tax=Candidatus Cyanaurora vandensis TaxID=2714958 RepID=UPI00257FCDEE|nr:bifunctional sterol desaturase/short chain dehydrogenase [Candidatus Cyanaurora vandensis]
MTFWLSFVLWGLFALLLAEVVRDGYHVLCHRVPGLTKLHNWHHLAYRRDLSLVSVELYQKAQLYHDILESALLVVVLTVVAVVSGVPGLWLGVVYALGFLLGGARRYLFKTVETDFNHLPGPLTAPPAPWWVNRAYHWRHHFDNPNAYYSGVFTLVDRVLGTALSLKGKTVAITGASGALGQALITELLARRARVVAFTTSDNLELPGVKVIPWRLGEEESLRAHLAPCDILITNHGVNVHSDRTPAAIHRSYEVNTFSTLRLIDLFLSTIEGPMAPATKEIWVNTSEAEVSPALSPLYELSKRSLGELITLKRLASRCTLRKLILGPFKSALNPQGVMSAAQVARGILFWAERDCRDIVVTINPLTYFLFPLKELSTGLYYRLFTRA